MTHLLRLRTFSVRRRQSCLCGQDKEGTEVGVGTPSLSEAPPSVQGCPGQGSRCRNPQTRSGGLLVCGAGGRAGAGASVHPRPQDISPSLPVCPAGRVRDTPGPEPHSSGTAPPPRPVSPARASSVGTAAPLSFTFRRLGFGPHSATAGPAPPGLARHLSLPQRPSRSQSQTQTPAPHGATPANSSAN